MRYKIAVGTTDGVNVTEHFGQAKGFFIYEIDQDSDETILVERRSFVDEDADGGEDCGCGGGHDETAVTSKLDALGDVQIILVQKIGGKSEKQVTLKHIVPLQFNGTIEDAFVKIKKSYKHRQFT
ncbi:MAG: hypothetical protein LBN00_04705 [Oscillospiraceae bacterium]|jgi:predicted Fe-Mo cluster-binding NifX family protein|nr:hypothetical protein [Oscillospiraceae bacterium]